jgi:glycosyltransferase involved in cell wall biosynthesis
VDRGRRNAGAEALIAVTRRLLSIATLYPSPQRPGFGRFVERQMRGLAARDDWHVTVINPIGLPPIKLARYAGLDATPLQEADGPIPVYHPRFTLIPGLSGRFNPALIARAVLPLARKLHAEAPFDLIDAQFFYPDGPAAARLAKALDLPLAIKARGSDIHYWGTRPAALAQMRRAAAQAGAILSVSQALARDMAALALPTDKMHVHYTGLDHERFHPVPRAAARQSIMALGIPSLGRLIVSVGALIAIKGQALAIRALATLPDDVTLAIAGTGPDEAALKALAAELGLTERVVFLGSVGHDVMPSLLSAADAMVLPSEREGLANAWIEALACGAPLVIPDIGGAREVVRSPAAGRIAARDPAAIAQALTELFDNLPKQADVAACAARFSWDANAAALTEIYEGVVAAR